MKNLVRLAIPAVVTALAAISGAQLTPVGPFSGALSDNFESYPDYSSGGNYDTLTVMGGNATFSSNPAGSNQIWIYNPSAGDTWGLDGNGYATTNSGNQGLGLYNPGLPVDVFLTFNAPVAEFGGYFASDTAVPSSLFTFFDAAGNVIGSTDTYHTGNVMTWMGWSSADPIASIEFSANLAPVMDDIQANPAPPTPEPLSIAVLGLSAFGMMIRRKKA